MRTSLINAIYDRLAIGQFQAADFTLTNRDTGRGYEFAIVYRYDPRFKLQGVISSNGETVSGTISPGSLSIGETFKVEGHSEILSLVSTWAGRINEELVAIPMARKIAEQEREIDKLIAQWQVLPDEYFTRDEAEELAHRLVILEEDLKIRIAALDMDEKKLKARTSEIERDIQFLKTQLENQKKPGWARAFATRCVAWARDSENRALLKDGIDIGRKLLGDGSAG